MNITVSAEPTENIQADALVFPAFEDGGLPEGIADPRARDLRDSGEFAGKFFDMAMLHAPSGAKAKRIVLAGAGKRAKFTPPELRNLAGAAVRFLKGKGLRSIAVALPQDLRNDDFTAAALEGALLGQYEPHRHKSDPKKDEKQIDAFQVAGGTQAGADRGRILGEAQNFSRDLVNEPGNLLTPTELARRASEMAKAFGLECEILEQDKMRELGMGALLGVAQGSDEPPALIVLRYRSTSKDHLGLVGKGVTFDTGGISIKPADGMEKMKYDMGGGAAVIGAMQAIAQLKPAVTVTALIPTVENMPGSRAQRPGDIVTSMSGKTIEVINTDAEGRLILSDALTYAARLGCTHLVDAATLTGSVVVALGTLRSGAFTNNEGFLAKVLAASQAEGERLWQLPLDDEYKEQIQSPFADLQNVGGRPAGSITAAMFLREFVGETPWVHLDIAGTAWLDDNKPYMSKGPTGFATRTFVRLASDW